MYKDILRHRTFDFELSSILVYVIYITIVKYETNYVISIRILRKLLIAPLLMITEEVIWFVCEYGILCIVVNIKGQGTGP